jgi:DNA-binding transcriptional ArsR family regulator
MSDDRRDVGVGRRAGLDYELAESVEADTPARLRALGHPLRSLIVDLVLERAMSVTELADRVRRPRGSVAHHVSVLVDAGLLQVVSTRRVRAVDERFYGRTGYTFTFPDHTQEGDLPFIGDARAIADFDVPEEEDVGGFTLRRARIAPEAAQEFHDRLMQLALEFAAHPRAGRREYAVYIGVFPTNRPVAPPDEPAAPPRKARKR